MTFPDHRLERPLEPPEARKENRQDVIPPNERNQDPERSTHELVTEGARPLTDEERKAADRDQGIAERVYAPASERVPKTVAGYRDVVDHTDTATPERQAVGQTAAVGVTDPMAENEPSFTRVPRPNASTNTAPAEETSFNSYTETSRWMSNTSSTGLMPMGLGWLAVGTCAGVGVWLWVRWQRERNKPINRLRRQARQTASEMRARMRELPDLPEIPDEAARPAVGLGTALLSIALILWQQSRRASQMGEARSQLSSRSRDMRHRADKASRRAGMFGRRAAKNVSDVDWQERLMQLKDLWTPGRIEMEKISLPRKER